MLAFHTGLIALAGVLMLPSAVAAATIQTFNDRAGFTFAAGQVSGLMLGLAGAPPVIVPDLVVGDLTLTAQDGFLAGDGGTIISTELDDDVLILNFARPVFGVGLFGGIVDEGFGFIDGELFVDLLGAGSASLVANGGAGYLGLLSDVGFTQVRLSITAFDGQVSSVGFVGLRDQVDVAGAVPEPASWAMLVAGFGLLGAVQRSRRTIAVA